MNAAPSAEPLAALYRRTSKHSHYQVLPSVLVPLLNAERLAVKSRHERERFEFIASHVPLEGRHFTDIGGNTGFFSFELLSHGAERVDCLEGNEAHHDFVHAAAGCLGLSQRLRTHCRYVSFDGADLVPADCTLLLNVLHHLGDDFGDRAMARQAAKQEMLRC